MSGMDDELCPVCSPTPVAPAAGTSALGERTIASYYMDLLAEAVKATGALECQAAPDCWYEADTALLAKNTCKGMLPGTRRCPLLELCGAAAIVGREQFGVWGGMSPRDRRNVLRGVSP